MDERKVRLPRWCRQKSGQLGQALCRVSRLPDDGNCLYRGTNLWWRREYFLLRPVLYGWFHFWRRKAAYDWWARGARCRYLGEAFLHRLHLKPAFHGRWRAGAFLFLEWRAEGGVEKYPVWCWLFPGLLPVLSAAEEEPVAERTISLKCFVRAHKWEEKRDSFCIFYGLNVSISYKLAVIHQTADNNSDYWFHSTHPYAFYYRIGMFRAGYSKEQEKNIFSTFFLH